MKKYIDCGKPVDLLVKDYDASLNGLDILKLYRKRNPDIKLSTVKSIVEDVPFYFAYDLLRVEADELTDELNDFGAEVEIMTV